MNIFLKLSLLLAGISLYYLSFVYGKKDHVPSYKRVLDDLQTLEDIAAEHGNSRSVINGHLASAEFVLSELHKMNDTFRSWTQDVPLNVQVDENPPSFSIYAGDHGEVSYTPRLQVATARGSGSSVVEKGKLVYVDSCEFSTSEEKFIAVVRTDDNELCNHCERMSAALREGAKAIVFISLPGNQQGYPHPLPPSPGRCGRKAEYQDIMKLVGVISLSDDAAYDFMNHFAANRDMIADIRVESAYREYISKNVLTESRAGDAENIVIFGSHLDSVPAGPGVNDDGSGAMGTLELARFFHEHLASKTKQKVRFAWWTGEEIGLLGSIYYVEQLKQNAPSELAAHKLNIDTDMIASPNFVRGVWDGKNIKDEETRKKTRAVHLVIKEYFEKQGLETFDFEFNGRSDFAPFLDAGIPAGGVITGEDEIKTPEMAAQFGGIANMVLDPCYHQDCDRVRSLQGPGEMILEQNMEALGYVLERYTTAEDLEGLLNRE